MKHIEIPTDDPLEMIWAIREKHYEETKDMTWEERSEYYRKKSESALRQMKETNPDDYDLSFLHKKRDK